MIRHMVLVSQIVEQKVNTGNVPKKRENEKTVVVDQPDDVEANVSKYDLAKVNDVDAR